MTDDRYMTFKFNKKIIEDVDGLLRETDEYKSRTQFIYEAIKSLVEMTRIKNSLKPEGRTFFQDLLVKKRLEAYDEAKNLHGTTYAYYSGPVIEPKDKLKTIKT